MKASERLRELMAAAERPKHGEDSWEQKQAWDRANEAMIELERIARETLPFIADVVEAAERLDADLETNSAAGSPNYLIAALIALDNALEEGDE